MKRVPVPAEPVHASSPPTIDAAGLTLRAFVDADADAFVAAVRESVDTVGRWMSWCHADYTVGEALAWFSVARAAFASGHAHEFGVFDAATGAFVGGAGLNGIDRQHRLCNLGYWVRQSRHRQRIASRCVAALTTHAFAVLDLRRVEIVVATGNAPSEAVARASGASFEAVARNRLVIDERSVAASVFSIVPET